MIRRSFRLALVGMAASAGAAAAQPAARPAEPLSQTAPLSLQTQLGAIPLVSPRTMQQVLKLREVRVTQLSEAGLPVGEARVFECPDSNCQQAVAFEVGGEPLPFMADIQFVGHGAYVTLQTRAVAVGAVVEFEKGRRGPVFLRGEGSAAMAQTLRFALSPAATLRRLDAAPDSRALAAGNVYTRKTAPDLVLKVEIGAARERGP